MSLGSVATEAQLLSKYWNRRLSGSDNSSCKPSCVMIENQKVSSNIELALSTALFNIDKIITFYGTYKLNRSRTGTGSSYQMMHNTPYDDDKKQSKSNPRRIIQYLIFSIYGA
jgi:hypothetical protein